MDFRKTALSLFVLTMFAASVNATILFDTTELVDTIAGIGDVIAAVADILPEIQDVLITLAIIAFVVGLISVFLGFITGILNLEKMMKLIKGK